ncbi:restriction endonuclease subunit S [Chungangia koreensis]|uniref:Restriction endonuclease subunit S n=1 Tax=Chungangia koreensis TaxID=752657 RepID=A0ABV8X7Q9_9LACT
MLEKNKPSLRYKEFTDPWEQKKLGEISEKVTEKNKNNLYYETLTNSAEFGIINQREFFDKDISNEKSLHGYYVVRPDDFVYNPRISNLAPVGPINRNNLGRTGVMSPLYYVFRTHGIDKIFLEKYFSSNKWHKFMWLNGDSGARSDRFSIKDSVFREMPIPLPQEEEQIKIGNFLKQLDDIIAVSHRKYLKLKQIKKALLIDMFPSDGSDKPNLRLNGFEDTWKMCQLGECFSERNERTSEGELLSVTIDSGVVKASSLERRDSSSEDKSNYKKVNVGDIAYNSMRMWQGASGVSNYSGIVSPAYTVITPNTDISSLFFSYQFKLTKMIQTFEFHSQGLTSDTWNLKYPTLKNIEVLVPSYEEQIKIGSFFKQLDDTISLQYRKYEKITRIKKALIQDIFV